MPAVGLPSCYRFSAAGVWACVVVYAGSERRKPLLYAGGGAPIPKSISVGGRTLSTGDSSQIPASPRPHNTDISFLRCLMKISFFYYQRIKSAINLGIEAAFAHCLWTSAGKMALFDSLLKDLLRGRCRAAAGTINKGCASFHALHGA